MTLEAAREELGIVMKERKTQEILRDKDFEEFKKELMRQESKEIDELVSYTYNPNQKKDRIIGKEIRYGRRNESE